jgi:hypothetical protein
MRRIFFALALLASTAACRGKAPKSSIAWEQKTPYTKGSIFQHVPATCAGGSLYIDLPAVLKNEATAQTAESMAARIARDFNKSSGKEGSNAVTKAFRDEGFEPLRDTKEIAVCYRASESTLYVFAGDYSGKDLLGALRKAASSKDDELQIENVHGVPTLSLEKLTFARVAPNVLVMGEDVMAATRLSKPFDRSSEWGWKSGRILLAELAGPDHWHFSVGEAGPDIDFVATSRTKLTLPELEQGRARVSKRLEETPLKLLSKPAETTKIDVAAGTATYSVRLPASIVAETVRIVTELPPGEMKRILGFLLAPESNEQKM